MSKTGLGKGLSALIPTITDLKETENSITDIEVSAIIPNTYQPRRVFDDEKLHELAASIKEHGVVQPVVVRQLNNGKYELVVGERRWRACRLLQLQKIPAVIKEYSEEQMMEIALVENIQRQDLNPLEEAQAYQKLLTDFNYTQEQVAQKVSKSRSFVANMVRLLNLAQPVLERLSAGDLTIGHARPLLAVEEPQEQIKAAEAIIANKMTVREAENYVKALNENKGKKKSISKKKSRLSPDLIDLETKLRERCGTKVLIKANGHKGKIEIDYYNNDDLNRILSYFFKDEL
ncbi:MAG: ParB/RepB/Spo0J family partition protein [Clostridia bacterium]|nr:ParB/RepB/Spo0J family partition protein [Clostridia bacterium]